MVLAVLVVAHRKRRYKAHRVAPPRDGGIHQLSTVQTCRASLGASAQMLLMTVDTFMTARDHATERSKHEGVGGATDAMCEVESKA